MYIAVKKDCSDAQRMTTHICAPESFVLAKCVLKENVAFQYNSALKVHKRLTESSNFIS